MIQLYTIDAVIEKVRLNEKQEFELEIIQAVTKVPVLFNAYNERIIQFTNTLDHSVITIPVSVFGIGFIVRMKRPLCIQCISDYRVNDVIGIIRPELHIVTTISGTIISINENELVVKPKKEMYSMASNIIITQLQLDNEDVVIAKYN